MSDSVEQFAEKYFAKDVGRAVPLHLLRAWLSMHHDHTESGMAFVPSMELDEWAQEIAVSRVVDHLAVDGKEVWHFFENEWHKAGTACETHLQQSQARLVRATFPDDVDTFVRSGQVGGMSIIEGELPEVKSNIATSSTTGIRHVCPLEPGETCYWSGDPYASHEMGY